MPSVRPSTSLLARTTAAIKVAQADGWVSSPEVAAIVKGQFSPTVSAKERKAFFDGFANFLNLTPDGRSAAVEVMKGEFYPAVPAPADGAPAIEKALAMGRQFILWGTSELEADRMTDYQGGEDAFECTQFASWLLKKAGLIDATFQRGGALKEHALARGNWAEVPKTEMKVGDLVRLVVQTDLGPVQHTALLSRFTEAGEPVYLGSHYPNGRMDIQVVGENRLKGAEVLWVLRPS